MVEWGQECCDTKEVAVTRVMVIDDDPTFRELATLTLSVSGFEVDCAEDGLRALDHMELVCPLDTGCPDVVLVDLKMPHLDGREFVEKVAQTFAGGPAIVVLASEHSAEVAQALRQGGARTIMRKPVEPDELIREVRRAAQGG